jgi:aspartyl-tRNA(Asn)/glutamyl-tRNA(Gln) amidotransferase subunit A
MLRVIAGYDPLDPVSADVPTADYSAAIRMPVSKLRVGVPRTPFFDNLDPEVGKAVNSALEVIRKMTASVQDVQIPATGNIADVWNPEIYAYHMPWITKSPELYQEATRNLIQRAGDGRPAAYAEARHQVDVIRRDIKKVFSNVDLLITPTQRGIAPLIVQPQRATAAGRGAAGGGAVAGGGGGIVNTAAFDLYGLPTITVPCGFSASGLPIGLQISGAHFAESTVLALAHAYEQATEWHTKRPKLPA